MSAQAGLFDSVLPNYVQRCLELGGRIVKRTKGCVGMILCPSCQSEKGLMPDADLRRGKDSRSQLPLRARIQQ